MPFERRMAWNLSVLQRKDARVARIVGSACFVSLYDFDCEEKSWSKMECEGCLFLVRRQAAPYYQMVVLNKMSPEDNIVSVVDTTNIEVSQDYLMMNTEDGDIVGYWFYDSQEREMLVLQLEKIIQEQANGGGAPPIPYTVQTSSLASLEGNQVPGYYAQAPSYTSQQHRQDIGDRERFKRTLIKLIETDDDFVDRIYDVFQQQIDDE